MMKRNIILASILSALTIFFIFIYMSFVNSLDCSQLVIDTYELHSKIDIPEVDFVNCYYNEELNTRISVYNLNGTIDLDHFKKVRNSSKDYFLGDALLGQRELPSGAYLYLASGERWGRKWTYAVDQESKRLWAELKY